MKNECICVALGTGERNDQSQVSCNCDEVGRGSRKLCARSIDEYLDCRRYIIVKKENVVNAFPFWHGGREEIGRSRRNTQNCTLAVWVGAGGVEVNEG